MSIWVRQVALITNDFQKTAIDIGAVLGLEVCHIDPAVGKYGLKNTMWAIGSQFLELITPLRGDTAGGRFLNRRGGDSGYVLCTQVTDLDGVRERVKQANARIVNDISGTGTGHEGIQLHPADTGGCFWEIDHIYLEDGDKPNGPWPPGGSGWQSFVNQSRVASITGVELQVNQPHETAGLWSAIAGCAVRENASGVPFIEAGDSVISFVSDLDGRGPGLAGIEISVSDIEAIRRDADIRGCLASNNELLIAGVRIYLKSD